MFVYAGWPPTTSVCLCKPSAGNHLCASGQRTHLRDAHRRMPIAPPPACDKLPTAPYSGGHRRASHERRRSGVPSAHCATRLRCIAWPGLDPLRTRSWPRPFRVPRPPSRSVPYESQKRARILSSCGRTVSSPLNMFRKPGVPSGGGMRLALRHHGAGLPGTAAPSWSSDRIAGATAGALARRPFENPAEAGADFRSDQVVSGFCKHTARCCPLYADGVGRERPGADACVRKEQRGPRVCL